MPKPRPSLTYRGKRFTITHPDAFPVPDPADYLRDLLGVHQYSRLVALGLSDADAGELTRYAVALITEAGA